MAVTSTRSTFESWFSNPSELVSRKVIRAEITNPEIRAGFVLSNLIILAPIFLKFTKPPSSSFDDVALNCYERVKMRENVTCNLE